MKRKVFTLLLAIASSASMLFAGNGPCGMYPEISYNVANYIASELENNGTTDEWYYISGWVHSINDINPQYGNATYYISNGNTTFYCYRLKYLFNSRYTGTEDFEVGDYVVICCQLRNYNDIYEAVNGYLVYSDKFNCTAQDGLVFTKISYNEAVVDCAEKEYLIEAVIPEVVEIEGTQCRVTKIAPHAFAGCTNLNKVTIGKNVNEFIAVNEVNFTFDLCSNIETVVWNAVNCIDMEYSPFYYSRNKIKEFIIADDIKRIPANMCWGIKNITSLHVPSTVKEIGKDAFYETGIIDLIIPNSVQFVGGRSFQNCPLQKVMWDVPAQEDYDFIEETPHNITVSLDASNLDWSKINLFAWYGNKLILGDWPGKKIEQDINGRYTFTFDASYTQLNIIWNNGADQTVDINNVTESGIYHLTSNSGTKINYTTTPYLASLNSPFRYSTDVKEFTFGPSVTHIPAHICENMSNLTEIVIPNSVSEIGRSAFEGCSKVEELTLGHKVSSIKEKAFASCKRIADINCYAEYIPEIKSNTFDGVSRKAYVWVPADQVRKYETDADWGEFIIMTKEAEQATTTTVQVDPSETTADVIWPVIANAATYELVIKDKNGNVICTLIFNASGLLTEIAFKAPGRNATQQAQSEGFSFKVTGLDIGTEYDLILTSKDKDGETLDEQVVSFTTQGGSPQAIDNISDDASSINKVLRDGQMYILRGEKVWTVTGQEVK